MQEIVINGIKLKIERLSPSKQFYLLLKLIGIIAKGNINYSGQITQLLHNQLGTGEEVDTSKEQKFEGDTLTLLVSAIKGALSTLSDSDRDYLIDSLLANVKIIPNEQAPDLVYQASMEQFDKRFSSYADIVKVLVEVVKINFTRSTVEKQ